MDKFLDLKYQMTDTENFKDLLIYLGKNFIERQIASAFKPVQSLSRNQDGKHYTFHYYSTLLNYDIVFEPGVAFIENKPDGSKFNSLLVIEDNKLIHTEKNDKGKDMKHVYEFYAEKMIATTTADGMENVVKRYYALAK